MILCYNAFSDLETSWENTVYVVNNRTTKALHTTINKGREGNAYLNYIMEHYDDLRDITVFLHAHRNGSLYAWHNDAPDHNNVVTIQSLRLGHVLEQGYVNLRCRHLPGCPPASIQPFRDPPDTGKQVEPYMAEAWEYMFPGIPVPLEIGVACCAQFAVTREQIRARPREDYERIFSWLMETSLNDSISGRVLEYTWHIIFGRKAQQ